MAGFDVYEDNRSFTQEGITGEVSRYTAVDISYPYFMIVNTKEAPVPLFKLKFLPSLFISMKSKNISQDEVKNGIFIYFKEGDTVLQLGKIIPRQVKTFLDAFSDYNLVCMYDKDTELTEDMRYILSN